MDVALLVSLQKYDVAHHYWRRKSGILRHIRTEFILYSYYCFLVGTLVLRQNPNCSKNYKWKKFKVFKIRFRSNRDDIIINLIII